LSYLKEKGLKEKKMKSLQKKKKELFRKQESLMSKDNYFNYNK
jgi:hypothetical protein